MYHTDEYIKEISEKIDSKKDYYAEISNKIWEFAEPRFQEYRSSELLQHVLKQAGFSIKADLAGEKTAFIAEYGSGKPVIAFLGEFDALPGLSQKADAAERIPANTGSCGHGCGHQLIGTGTLASVIVLKDFVKEHNLPRSHAYAAVDQFIADRSFGGRFQPKEGWLFSGDNGGFFGVWEKIDDTIPGNAQKPHKPGTAAAANPVCWTCKSTDVMMDWAYLGDPNTKAKWSRASNPVDLVHNINHALNCNMCHDPHSAQPRIVRDA